MFHNDMENETNTTPSMKCRKSENENVVSTHHGTELNVKKLIFIFFTPSIVSRRRSCAFVLLCVILNKGASSNP